MAHCRLITVHPRLAGSESGDYHSFSAGLDCFGFRRSIRHRIPQEVQPSEAQQVHGSGDGPLYRTKKSSSSSGQQSTASAAEATNLCSFPSSRSKNIARDWAPTLARSLNTNCLWTRNGSFLANNCNWANRWARALSVTSSRPKLTEFSNKEPSPPSPSKCSKASLLLSIQSVQLLFSRFSF